MRVDSTGLFYAVDPVVSCPAPFRRACRDESMVSPVKPWVGAIHPNDMNVAFMQMCIELDAPGPTPDAKALVTFELIYGATSKPRLTRMQQTAPVSPNWAGVGLAYFPVTSPATQAYFKAN